VVDVLEVEVGALVACVVVAPRPLVGVDRRASGVAADDPQAASRITQAAATTADGRGTSSA